jgi:uncharacterized protein YndB with AHSA1/START domain
VPKPQHIHEIYIRTTPELLWQALTDAELTVGYYRGCAVRSTWQPGAPYEYMGRWGPEVAGEIVEIEPPRRLVMTFTLAGDVEAATEPLSRVTWEITPVGDVCRLTLVHSDFGGLSKTWAATLTEWTPILSGLKTLLETGSSLGPVADDRPDPVAVDVGAEWQRDLGIETNQEVWRLLETPGRTPDEDEAMVRAAYASAYHWSRAARRMPANEARAEWMISHVHAVLRRADMAHHHAARCLAVVDANGLEDFDRAYAHEALARAAAGAGRVDEARRARDLAAAVPIADEEDRKIFAGDLAAEPWFGVPTAG